MDQSVWTSTYYLLSQFWRFFNSWYFPGTNVTPAGILFLSLFALLVIRLVKRVFQINSNEKGE